MTTRVKWPAAMVGIAAAVLSAILMRGLLTDAPGQVVKTPSGTVVIAAETDGGSDAAIRGTLALTSDGCIGIGGPQDRPGDVTAVVLPAGTKVLDRSPLLLEVNGRQYRMGDEISGGGGDVEPGDRDSPVPQSSLACLTRTVFVMSDAD